MNNKQLIFFFALSLMGAQAVRGNEGENFFASEEKIELTPEQREEALRVLADAKKVFAKTGEALDATIEKVKLEGKSTSNDCDECDFLKNLSEKGVRSFFEEMQKHENYAKEVDAVINDLGLQDKKNRAFVIAFLVQFKADRQFYPLEYNRDSAVAHINKFVKEKGAKWADVQAAFALVNRCHARHYSAPVISMPVEVPAYNESVAIAGTTFDNIEVASTQPVDPVISPVIDVGSAA